MRIVITGAARGIGASLARRLGERGDQVALIGLEPELMAEVAARLPHATCYEGDVTNRSGYERVVERAAKKLGGIDVVVANAGVAAQLPLVGGNPDTFDRTIAVNIRGVYDTIRTAGPYLMESGGYALLISSLGAAVHLPLMGGYSASKAAVEALGNALRGELAPSGARVGIAYFAELETDMTRRGFGTNAARQAFGGRAVSGVAPLAPAIDALVRGIDRRRRVIVSPWWVRPLLPTRAIAQRVLELALGSRVAEAVAIARREDAPLTTELPSPSASESPA